LLVRPDYDHLFFSDVHNLIFSMQEDFPEIVSVESIGKSWQDRDIYLMKIDGLNYLTGGQWNK